MAFDADFFRDLCLAPGPSGFEAPVQRVLRRRAAELAVVHGDGLGSLWAEANERGAPHLVVAGHADQVGFIVTGVDEAGFVFVDPIGHVDSRPLGGCGLVVHGAQGRVHGVIGRQPPHLASSERGKSTNDPPEQFLDIGAASREEALLRVAIGDPVTFASQFREMSPGVYASQACDNRCGLYAAFRALEECAQKSLSTRYTALSTVQEETTFMGARARTPHLRPDCLIVVDAEFATDHPGIDARRTRGDVKLGAGPVIHRGAASNETFFHLATEVAKREGIPFQVKAAPGAMSTDADEMMAAGSGVTLSLSIPVRYMHSALEVVHADDLRGLGQPARVHCWTARRSVPW